MTRHRDWRRRGWKVMWRKRKRRRQEEAKGERRQTGEEGKKEEDNEARHNTMGRANWKRDLRGRFLSNDSEKLLSGSRSHWGYKDAESSC